MRSYKICKLEAFLSFEIGLGNRNSKPCEKQYQLVKTVPTCESLSY